MKISKLKINDEDKIVDLFDSYRVFYSQESDKKLVKSFLRSILQEKEALIYVIEEESKTIGFTTCYFSYSSVSLSKIAIINDLFILPDFRNRGFAKKLMNFTIDDLRNLGFAKIRWCSLSDNLPALNLYENIGANSSNWVHYDLA